MFIFSEPPLVEKGRRTCLFQPSSFILKKPEPLLAKHAKALVLNFSMANPFKPNIHLQYFNNILLYLSILSMN